MVEITGGRSVPRVFIGGTPILPATSRLIYALPTTPCPVFVFCTSTIPATLAKAMSGELQTLLKGVGALA
eukprot:1532370-Rhodomonas_salina.1